jgi:hypothetical protein
MKLSEVAPGDIVTRLLAGTIPMDLKVTAVDGRFIYCGPKGSGWKFDRASGAEVDEEIGWGPAFGATGSYLSAAHRPDKSKPGRPRRSGAA